MAIDFPPAPAVGAVYTYNGISWTWTGQYWNSVGGSGGTGGPEEVYSADTPPAAPVHGDLWFDTTTGKQYTWHDNYWIEVTGVGGNAHWGPVDAIDLIGTTMAPTVENYPTLTVQRPEGSISVGGGILFQGGPAYEAVSVAAFRWQDTFQVKVQDDVPLVVEKAGGYIESDHGDYMEVDRTGIWLGVADPNRLYLNNRATYQCVGFYEAVPPTITLGAAAVMMQGVLNIPVLTGDVLEITAVIDFIAGGGALDQVGISINTSMTTFPQAANFKGASGDRGTVMTFGTWTAPGPSTPKIQLWGKGFSAPYGTVNNPHTVLKVVHWGIR